MPLGIFAAMGAIAVASVEIDGIGATTLPTIPPKVTEATKNKVTTLNTSNDQSVNKVVLTSAEPGVAEILASMAKNAEPETITANKINDPDPNRRSGMQFAKDDETSTDWMK